MDNDNLYMNAYNNDFLSSENGNISKEKNYWTFYLTWF